MSLFAFVTLPENFWVGVTGSVIFGFLGIVLLLGGFKLFDWLLPRVDFQKELHDSPIASAIVIAAFFLALAHIIASVVH
jgi:uncharacterized membrane protein YjfL (UPF0719 family)